MRPRIIAPSILLALLMFSAGPVSAADPKPESIPPFCKVSKQCSPEYCTSAKGAGKGVAPAPKKAESASCTSCEEGGVVGKCSYLQDALAWVCCSRSPYPDKK